MMRLGNFLNRLVQSLMLDGPAVVAALETCGITHVAWIPDSHLGCWEAALLQSPSIRVVRACREGEAIAIAAGLILGGARPVVIIQCTGLFEAGDALRNAVHDLRLPLVLIVGVRGYLAHRDGKGSDNCPVFTEPILDAWQIPRSLLIPEQNTSGDLVAALRDFERSRRAGVILIAE